MSTKHYKHTKHYVQLQTVQIFDAINSVKIAESDVADFVNDWLTDYFDMNVNRINGKTMDVDADADKGSKRIRLCKDMRYR